LPPIAGWGMLAGSRGSPCCAPPSLHRTGVGEGRGKPASSPSPNRRRGVCLLRGPGPSCQDIPGQRLLPFAEEPGRQPGPRPPQLQRPAPHACPAPVSPSPRPLGTQAGLPRGRQTIQQPRGRWGLVWPPKPFPGRGGRSLRCCGTSPGSGASVSHCGQRLPCGRQLGLKINTGRASISGWPGLMEGYVLLGAPLSEDSRLLQLGKWGVPQPPSWGTKRCHVPWAWLGTGRAPCPWGSPWQPAERGGGSLQPWRSGRALGGWCPKNAGRSSSAFRCRQGQGEQIGS